MAVLRVAAGAALMALLFMGACWMAGFWFTAGAFFFMRGGF